MERLDVVVSVQARKKCESDNMILARLREGRRPLLLLLSLFRLHVSVKG
jgi:hypothetical protein